MRLPLILLKHIAKAYLNAMTGGIAGEFVFGIAEDVIKAWQRECDEIARRGELEKLAQAATDEVKEAVAEVVSQVAPDRTDTVRGSLSAYLTQVPPSIRRTLRRPSDPSGRTVPHALAVRTALDLAPLLPSRVPRFQPGDRPLAVDRELVELLGVGGFGEVWKAINPNRPSMPPVALKFCLDDAAKDRLLRHEARLLDRVMQVGSHPGIVALRETYLNAEPPCLEYEYVGGGELTSLIQEYHRTRGGFSPKGAARIVERLAVTVGAFHRLTPTIVHRDLKPANILINFDDKGRIGLKIADFGIGGLAASREIERSQTRQTQGGVVCSISHGSYTPLYASPEQVRGEPPDPRDDVHALGVVWFQMLTGDLSAGAPTGLDWIDELQARGMSREQIELLASCISSRQARRPADAAVLAARVDAVYRLRERIAEMPEPAPRGFAKKSDAATNTNGEVGVEAEVSKRPASFEKEPRNNESSLASAGSLPPGHSVDRRIAGDGASEGPDEPGGKPTPMDDMEGTAPGKQSLSFEGWLEVRSKLGLSAANSEMVKDMIRTTMEVLEVRHVSDTALSVNWRGRKALAISYGKAKVLNIEPKGRSFEIWIIAPSEDVTKFSPQRKFNVFTFKHEYSPVTLVYLRTGATPALTREEYEFWRRGLAMVRNIAKGSWNPFHGHENSLIGPWLQELCPGGGS